MVTTRSFSPMKCESAFMSVVLPVPVPPEMMRLTGFDHASHQRRAAGRDGADLNQPVEVERNLGELADRQERPVQRHGLDDCVDARAVGEASVDHRLRFIDTPADGGDDLVDDPQKMRLVLEGDVHAAAACPSARRSSSRAR